MSKQVKVCYHEDGIRHEAILTRQDGQKVTFCDGRPVPEDGRPDREEHLMEYPITLDSINMEKDQEKIRFLFDHGMRIMHYYGERILGHVDQIKQFAIDGMYYCEGAERERLANLLCNADLYFDVYDCWDDEIPTYRHRSDQILLFDEWQEMDLLGML